MDREADMTQQLYSGPKAVEDMTDRELLEECVTNQRLMLQTVQSFVDAMKSNPMFGMMAKKFGA